LKKKQLKIVLRENFPIDYTIPYPKRISQLANLKESAMILGHWDSDPFDNYKPKRHDNRRNSGSNLSHQNHYYQKYNSQTHSYPRIIKITI